MANKISIIVEDEMVVIDGEGRKIDGLAALLPAGVHAIQVENPDDPSTRSVAVEWKRNPDEPIKRDTLPYNAVTPIRDAWEANPPVPPKDPLPVSTSATALDKLDALWDAVVNNDMTRVEAVKAKLING